MSNLSSASKSAFSSIKSLDYCVIIVRDMAAMRHFYENILKFNLDRELSPNWLEYRIGDCLLTLSNPGLTAADVQLPKGNASLQLAFKVPVHQVDRCADELRQLGIDLVSPPKDQDFGHRTVFFRDPDGNLLEIYAEI